MEKKMKTPIYLLLFIALLSQSPWVYSGQPLDRELVDSFFTVSEKLETIDKKYPAIAQKADKFLESEETQLINYLKSSKAYPDINRILSSSGFNNLTEYFEISSRIMGGILYVQMKNMPTGMDINNIDRMYEQNIQKMKKNGAPADVIKRMETDHKNQQSAMQKMKMAMKRLSSADKKFVNENIEWLMNRLPEDDMGKNTIQ